MCCRHIVCVCGFNPIVYTENCLHHMWQSWESGVHRKLLTSLCNILLESSAPVIHCHSGSPGPFLSNLFQWKQLCSFTALNQLLQMVQHVAQMTTLLARPIFTQMYKKSNPQHGYSYLKVFAFVPPRKHSSLHSEQLPTEKQRQENLKFCLSGIHEQVLKDSDFHKCLLYKSHKLLVISCTCTSRSLEVSQEVLLFVFRCVHLL